MVTMDEKQLDEKVETTLFLVLAFSCTLHLQV
jgi:hypothetical protein